MRSSTQYTKGLGRMQAWSGTNIAELYNVFEPGRTGWFLVPAVASSKGLLYIISIKWGMLR